jgi:uncharacterized protein YciI
MSYFFVKTIPPRTTFHQDMSDAERTLMQEHVAYWTDLTEKRIAILFGPVLAPEGSWGAGVVEVEREADVRALVANDPTFQASLLTFEMYPMRIGMIRT